MMPRSAARRAGVIIESIDSEFIFTWAGAESGALLLWATMKLRQSPPGHISLIFWNETVGPAVMKSFGAVEKNPDVSITDAIRESPVRCSSPRFNSFSIAYLSIIEANQFQRLGR